MTAGRLHIADAAAMEAAGGRLARLGPGGLCIHLRGPLAAGKTTFARGYLRALGHPGAVKSPTFTLVESYVLATREVHHFDLYRLADAEELEFIGIDEYFAPGIDCLIEWPERGAGVLPGADVTLDFTVDGDTRDLSLQGLTGVGSDLVSRFFNSQKTEN